jgi:hypothetical protein
MNEIIEPTIDYDFSKLFFGPPTSLAGETYFAKIINNNKQLFIQTPKCLTKQGFVKSGQKFYVDLMFNNNDTIFIEWIENLLIKCQDLVFSKKDTWFQTQLEKDDIETAFTSPLKIFKSGKFYLLRVNVNPNIKIYDENDSVIPLDSVSNDKYLISIIEILGLKFTSKNFQLEFELKQSMIVTPDPFLNECFIKKPKTIKKENDNLENIINNSISDLNIKKNNNKKEEQVIDLEVSFNDNSKNEVDVEDNIILDIEELEQTNDLTEFKFEEALDNLETITLKKPNQVYEEMYNSLKEKARLAKKNAILAYIELKNIKKTYLLDIDESDEEFDDYVSTYENNQDSLAKL